MRKDLVRGGGGCYKIYNSILTILVNTARGRRGDAHDLILDMNFRLGTYGTKFTKVNCSLVLIAVCPRV